MREYVLVIAPEEPAHVVAQALREHGELTVEVAGTRRDGLVALRRAEWSRVVLEDSNGGSAPDAAERFYGRPSSAKWLSWLGSSAAGSRHEPPSTYFPRAICDNSP